ncbi:unnamed protein product [Prorocentrum cordatum]|uniref:Uncharacterized protein n=1 Tax=Prorocentrum cordatum TaxID=2364126 RepID=A0ABN9VK46_9DINO|nr:unnamed protein product [Polarella glacialis]
MLNFRSGCEGTGQLAARAARTTRATRRRDPATGTVQRAAREEGSHRGRGLLATGSAQTVTWRRGQRGWREGGGRRRRRRRSRTDLTLGRAARRLRGARPSLKCRPRASRPRGAPQAAPPRGRAWGPHDRLRPLGTRRGSEPRRGVSYSPPSGRPASAHAARSAARAPLPSGLFCNRSACRPGRASGARRASSQRAAPSSPTRLLESPRNCRFCLRGPECRGQTRRALVPHAVAAEAEHLQPRQRAEGRGQTRRALVPHAVSGEAEHPQLRQRAESRGQARRALVPHEVVGHVEHPQPRRGARGEHGGQLLDLLVPKAE